MMYFLNTKPHFASMQLHYKSVLNERLKTIDEDTEKGNVWDEFIKNYKIVFVGKRYIKHRLPTNVNGSEKLTLISVCIESNPSAKLLHLYLMLNPTPTLATG